jgi:AcrR family transcriptional regulator
MRDGQATRERIERTAMALFVEKGVTETTIRDIAAGAGVAEGALYRHYRGKDELVVGLFAQHYADFARRLERVQGDAPGTQAKLGAMIAECCRVFDEDPVLFRFLLLVQHHSMKHIEDGPDNPVEAVRLVLARGMDAGEIARRDSNVATAMVMGVILQTATFKLYGRIDASMTSLAETLTDAAWRILHP